MTVLWVITAIGLAWVASYLAGGSSTAVPHAFYIPIIVAAVRFGSPGVLLTSLAAGLVVGPLMPLDVDASVAQSPENWATRLVIFVLIGQFTAYLVRHSLPSLTTQFGDRRTRSEIRDAITHGQMRVEYQPIIDLASGDVVGAEALVRWDHPSRGLLGPDVFVCDAERTGCIDDITRFVLTEACTQVARWRTGVLSGCEQFKIAVNLSGADLSNDNLPVFVGDVLAESGLPNDWLHLEVTETALVADVDAATSSLMALRILGVRLALDDFGTGASSLAHLHHFPLDVVKIDRLFVSQADTHEHSAILTNAHHLLGPHHGPDHRGRGHREPRPSPGAPRLRLRVRPGLPVRPSTATGELRVLLRRPRRHRPARHAQVRPRRRPRPLALIKRQRFRPFRGRRSPGDRAEAPGASSEECRWPGAPTSPRNGSRQSLGSRDEGPRRGLAGPP